MMRRRKPQAAYAGVDREAYLDEVLYKTAYVLIAQFYRLFWRADEACITYIAQSLRKLREQMSADRFTQLCDFNTISRCAS
mgnify:CR=1 FL=1